jgi:hypothetical protein
MLASSPRPGDHNVIPGSANMHVHACKQHQNVFARTDWAPALGLLEVQVNSCVDDEMDDRKARDAVRSGSAAPF